MELRGMVVVNGMAQLVDNDEIAQMLRKRHQEKAQRNVVRPGTAPPLRTRGTDRQLVVLQPRDAGEPTDTVGQVGFGGAPQLFDAGFFRGTGYANVRPFISYKLIFFSNKYYRLPTAASIVSPDCITRHLFFHINTSAICIPVGHTARTR